MQEISYPSRSALLLGLTCTRVQMKPKDILFLPISVADPVKQRIYSNMYVPAGSFGNAMTAAFTKARLKVTGQGVAHMLGRCSGLPLDRLMFFFGSKRDFMGMFNLDH